MGSCCFNELNQYSIISNNKYHTKSNFLKPGRSSLYQLNKEDISNVYDISFKISSGYYGTAYKACLKADKSKWFVVKSIIKENLSKKILSNLISEIQLLSKLDHPNIIKYYETYDDSKCFHIVMEPCEGGELLERIIRKNLFCEKEAAEILFKITHAISHCHSRNIVHRDLKGENILFQTKSLNKTDIKIIDFGLARKKNTINLHSIVGTPLYVAPEVLEGTYDKKCDIWAIGILMFLMLFGKYPFQDDNRTALFNKIRFQNPHLEKNSKLSKAAVDLLSLLLTKDPLKRPEACEVLDHPWFAKNLHDIFLNNVADLQIIPLLKHFKTPSPFIKKIIKFLIKEIDIPELEVLRHKFYIMDTKKTGIVDISKYKSDIVEPVCSEMTNTCIDSNDKSNKIFSNYLINKYCLENKPSTLTGKIDYTSFLVANCLGNNLITEDMITEVFTRFDVDNVGFITINGFHKALRRTGKNISVDETKAMLINAGFKTPNCITKEMFIENISEFLQLKMMSCTALE